MAPRNWTILGCNPSVSLMDIMTRTSLQSGLMLSYERWSFVRPLMATGTTEVKPLRNSFKVPSKTVPKEPLPSTVPEKLSLKVKLAKLSLAYDKF